MNPKQLSRKAQKVEGQFETQNPNWLQNFLSEEKVSAIEAQGLNPSEYKLFAVRTNELAGSEIFSPKNVEIGNYSEEVLYGAANSPIPHFLTAIRSLNARAEKIKVLVEADIEYIYQVTLFWAELSRLVDFIGLSFHISDLVTLLLNARAQYIGKDTPKSAIVTMADALKLAMEAKRLDGIVVSRMADALASGGVDLCILDAFRATYA